MPSVLSMHYPLISGELLYQLRMVHGIYNACITFLFFYLGLQGFIVRRARLSHQPLPFSAIKKHRRMGPVFAVLGMLGFFSGLTLIIVHTGRIFEYPSHLVVGLTVLILILWTLNLSRRIKGTDSLQRRQHFIIGIAILIVYLVEMFLGIRLLFGME